MLQATRCSNRARQQTTLGSKARKRGSDKTLEALEQEARRLRASIARCRLLIARLAESQVA